MQPRPEDLNDQEVRERFQRDQDLADAEDAALARLRKRRTVRSPAVLRVPSQRSAVRAAVRKACLSG